MDFFDFMFPEQAEATHLRSISNQLRSNALARNRNARSAGQAAAGTTAELEELQGDVRFLSMVLLAVVKRLSEEETLSVADLADLFDEIDGLDGTADGGLDVNVLRGALGAVRAAEAPEPDEPDTADEPANQARRAPVSSRRRLRRHRGTRK